MARRWRISRSSLTVRVGAWAETTVKDEAIGRGRGGLVEVESHHVGQGRRQKEAVGFCDADDTDSSATGSKSRRVIGMTQRHPDEVAGGRASANPAAVPVAIPAIGQRRRDLENALPRQRRSHGGQEIAKRASRHARFQRLSLSAAAMIVGAHGRSTRREQSPKRRMGGHSARMETAHAARSQDKKHPMHCVAVFPDNASLSPSVVAIRTSRIGGWRPRVVDG